MTQTAHRVWQSCLDHVKKNVSNNAYNRWFRPIKAVDLSDSQLTIQVPNPFFFEYLEEHFTGELKDALANSLGKKGKLKYQILMPDAKNHRDHRQRDSNLVPGTFQTEKIKNPFVFPGIKKAEVEHNLVPKYNFDNFIEGDCNRLARAAGLNIASNPGKTSFNPLVVYGGVGLGKTHLIHAIGNEVLKNHPEKQVLYVSSEMFTNQIIQSIKNQATEYLTSFYNNLDVLIVDDIQFLAGRKKTIDIFFHIFNHLHNNGRQIILSSDRAPKDLAGLEDRMITRFKWGLTADLQEPEFETRMAILLYKLEQHDLELPMAALEYICYNIENNIRELEGVVVTIMAQSRLNGAKLSLPMIKKIVTDFIRSDRKEITIEGIQEVVGSHFSIPVERLRSRSRTREVVTARQLAIYFCKKMTGQTFKTISNAFGGRDHTTGIYAVRTIENLISSDKDFHDEVFALEKRIEMTLT